MSTFDFKRLVDEVANDSHEPRAARCWPWSHAWTMWVTDPSQRLQARRCTGCGKAQRRTLMDRCPHRWETVSEGRILDEGRSYIGTFHNQQCDLCGDLRKVKLI